MKKNILKFSLLFVISALILMACGAQPAESTQPVEEVISSNEVIAEGRLEPVQGSNLTFQLMPAGYIYDKIDQVVVSADTGAALYFSRAPIPWDRQQLGNTWPAPPTDSAAPKHCLRHIGLYAYRAHFLPTYAAWPSTALEQAESLEQLRVLENGQRIRVVISDENPAHHSSHPSLRLITRLP